MFLDHSCKMFFIFFILKSTVCLAIIPNPRAIQVEPELADRLCAIQSINERFYSDLLSGFLLDSQNILSVGHTQYLDGKISYKCAGNSKNSARLQGVERHRNFDFVMQPKDSTGWARYDIALFRKASQASAKNPIQILNDKATIVSLVKNAKCILSGGGNEDGSFQNKDIIVITAPNEVSELFNLETHIGIEYSGKQIIVAGDSGGPLLCKHNGNWVLAGLIQYAGQYQDRSTGLNKNIVGIMLIRDELFDGFIKENLGR